MTRVTRICLAQVTLTAVPGSLQELVRTEDGKLVPIVDRTTVTAAVTSHATVPSAIAQCEVSPSSAPRLRRDGRIEIIVLLTAFDRSTDSGLNRLKLRLQGKG